MFGVWFVFGCVRRLVVCVALIYGAGCFAVWRGGVCAVILVGACLLVFG